MSDFVVCFIAFFILCYSGESLKGPILTGLLNNGVDTKNISITIYIYILLVSHYIYIYICVFVCLLGLSSSYG